MTQALPSRLLENALYFRFRVENANCRVLEGTRPLPIEPAIERSGHLPCSSRR